MSRTVRSKSLGAALRKLREAAGLDPAQAHSHLTWSRAKLDRIESGEYNIKPKDLGAALDLYGADAATRARLAQLRNEASQRGWYSGFADVWISGYAGLEDGASEVFELQTSMIPGLLQTRDYARAVITAANPDRPPEWIDKAVRARMNRKELLTRDVAPASLRCVIDEVVFRRLVGDDQVILAQISSLWEMAQRPNVTIQVLPRESGAYAAMGNSFIKLSFPLDAELTPVVFVEGLWGAVYLESPPDVDRFTRAEDEVVKDCLSPEMTVAYLATYPEARRK